ncbi:MAG TPA: PaaI family thioesterase [Lachnospiraceae bacterium]|nr:PaaI family thioesterase [Lachnospiraceae bacterium]
MDYTKRAQEVFAEDIFATKTTGIVIDQADVNYARCSLAISEKHLNANKSVMGGAIFTLADFAFAVASNSEGTSTVTLSSDIMYLGVAKGSTLIAETSCLKSGRKTCVMEIAITDELGTKVALVTTTGFRLG